jgi:hypothetical protein
VMMISPCKLCGHNLDLHEAMWEAQTLPADGPYHPDCYYRKWPAQTGPTPDPPVVPEIPRVNAIEILYSESWGIVCEVRNQTEWKALFPIGTNDLGMNRGLNNLLAETIPHAEIECSEIKLFQPATPFIWHGRQLTAEGTL